jgi:hypothetical protein
MFEENRTRRDEQDGQGRLIDTFIENSSFHEDWLY